MSRQVKFFSCYSINLHNFLKASGLRSMNKGTHDKGIDVSFDGGESWTSYSTVHQASKDLDIPVPTLLEIRTLLLSEKAPSEFSKGGTSFKKRIRFFWVYEVTPELEKALKIWSETGPRSEK